MRYLYLFGFCDRNSAQNTASDALIAAILLSWLLSRFVVVLAAKVIDNQTLHAKYSREKSGDPSRVLRIKTNHALVATANCTCAVTICNWKQRFTLALVSSYFSQFLGYFME